MEVARMPAMLWLAGVLLALYLPPGLAQAGSFAVAAAALAMLFMRGCRMFIFGAIAFFLTAHVARTDLDARWHCDERALVIARINSVPARTRSGWQFDAELRFEREPRRPLQARLSWRTDAASRPRAGETWRLAVQFRAPRQPIDVEGTDPARGLLRDHIDAEATVLKSPLNERRRTAATSLLVTRARLAERISARVVDPSAAALLAALAVGASGDVSRQQWRVFNATGITHLVAISGMHVTFFALISMALARRIWRMVPVLASRVGRERFAALTGVLLAAAYALLSGFSVPAQRTLVMLCAWLLLRESQRCIRPSWSLAIALFAVLAFDPFAVLSAGFWLSFAAVASLILIAGAAVKPRGALREAVIVQWVVSAALLPVTIAVFGTFSFVGLAVNAVAIPVFTFLLVPPILMATLGFLIGTTGSCWCADRLVDLAAWVATAGWPWLARCADPQWALWHAAPTFLWYLLAAPAVVIALLPWPGWIRAIALLCLATGFAPQSKRPIEASVWIDILDVGAGTTAVLRTREHTLVFGSSETFGSGGQRFASQVVPILRREGAADADLLVLGRYNRDRAAAMTSARAAFPRVHVMAAARADTIAPEVDACFESRWRWNGVAFHLSPSGSASDCSLWVSAAGTHALLMLDPDTGTVDKLLQKIAGSASLVLLPRSPAAISGRLHIGSIRQKQYIVASASANEWRASTWQHLRAELQGKDVQVLSTSEEGALHMELVPGSSARVEGQNSLRPGIWMAGDATTRCAR
jgi:competence protein ComEC